MKNKNKIIAIALSFLAGACFLVSFIFKRDNLKLILSITWILIGLGNLYKKDKE